MQHEEIALLKTEIARLNKIITALIKYNDLLSAEIALSKIGNRENNVGIAISEIRNGNSNIQIASSEIDNGNNNAHIVLPEILNGNLNEDIVLSEIGNGNLNVENILSEIRIGNLNVQHIVSEISKGNLNVQKTVPETGNSHQNVPKPLPGIITPSPAMLSGLINILKFSGFNKVRDSAIRNTALLLLHFHNKNASGHADLQKLTGLSRFGIAKFIGSLKKRGLIVRTGWQQFSITANGEALLRSAWEKMDGLEKKG